MDGHSSRAEQRRAARARDDYLRRSLGSATARPRIVARYRGDVGWEASRRERLDADVARRLWGEGITMVRVRRGWFLTREISLRHHIH